MTFDGKRSFGMHKKALAYSLWAVLFVCIVFGGFGFVLSVFDKPFSQWEVPFLKWETPSLAIGFVCVLAGCVGEEV